MSDSLTLGPATGGPASSPPELITGWDDRPVAESPAARHGASLLLVGTATALGYGLEPYVGGPNLTLIYVLPVVVSAAAFGWGPSLLATVGGVLAFDFFFTAPKYSLTIDSPTDIWAAALLFVIGALVSAVAAESRRRERAALRAADQAQALQSLAHVVMRADSSTETLSAAAIALNRIFRAPAVILLGGAGRPMPMAAAGDARITAAETEAAASALESHIPSRAGTYPFQASRFDFWPVKTHGDYRYVIGVGFAVSRESRPQAADRFVEIVGAYLPVPEGLD